MSPLRRATTNPLLSIEVGAAYEFAMSLVTVCEVANHAVAEVGGQWIADAQRRAGPELMARLRNFTQGTGDGFVHLIPLAYDAPAPRGVDEFLAHLAAIDAVEVVRVMVGYYDYHVRRATAGEVMDAAIAGDEGAVAQVVAATEGWGDWTGFIERILGQGAERTRDELLGLLRDWQASVWLEEEPRLMPILEHDAEAKRVLATEMPFDRFVEQATNGVQYVARPEIDRLVLVPSYVNRPWVSFAEHRGAVIMIYPVADESVAAESDAPPIRLIRLTKALADEKRLRILRTLAEGPRSLMELAELFEVPKTTMHHHMIALRSAGLVSVTAGAKEYRLRTDVLPSLAQLLGGYIGLPRAAEPERSADDAPVTPTRRTIGRHTPPATPAGRRQRVGG